MVGDSKLVWACELMVCVLWWTRDLARVFSYRSPDDRCVWLNAGVCGGSCHGAGEARIKPQEKLRERCWPPAGLWPSLVHIVAFEDGLTPDWICYFFIYIYIYINLESRKNNFHAHLISSELRKDLDVPEFFPFFPQTGANHFPLACCLRFMGYLRSVCAWKFVTHQNTRLQNCSPCLIFNFILCILSITEFPKDRISQVVKRHTSASCCS